MPRVLIVHYHFVPVHNVAVKRLLGYARHLPSFGWEPIVLTRDWRDLRDADPSWGLSWEPAIEAREGLRIYRVAHSPRRRMRAPRADDRWPVRKALSLAQMLCRRYPDEFIDWATPCVDAAVELARTHPFDVVLTYCPPETNHIVGGRIARRLSVPWIPFFGDLNGFFLAPIPAGSPGGLIRRTLHHRWMRPASAFAAITPYAVDYLSRTYRKPGSLVNTGFEPGEWLGHQASPPGDRFIVSHVGSVYPGNQRPEIFFDGLDQLISTAPEAVSRLEVRFVGSKCEDHLRRLIHGRPCDRVTRMLPNVSSTEAVSLIRQSHVLLAFSCTDHRRNHGTMNFPTKVFETFGAARPILAIPPDGDWMDTLLSRTRGGVSAGDRHAVAAVLRRWMESWSQTGVVPYRPNQEEIDALSTPRQTARLAALLTSVAGAAAYNR